MGDANTSATGAPFLRWAGGKRRLLGEILQRTPKTIEHYYEPFLGAGSVFFTLDSGIKKHVGDFNAELISVYEALRDEAEDVIAALSKMPKSKEHFLHVRSWDREKDFGSIPRSKRAARFIYLNKFGFNGLYRVNRLGQYNVPYGGDRVSGGVDLANLRRVGEFLAGRDFAGNPLVDFFAGDYLELTRTVIGGEGSFVYLDPPYHPTSATSNFVDYNENGFSEFDQRKLRDEALRLSSMNVRVMISNSNTDFIRELYSHPVFNLKTLSVRRVIAARSQDRKLAEEVLITNFRNEL
jgi:DNA adenine methylase